MPHRYRTYKPTPGTASARTDVLVQPRPAPGRARELATLKALDLTEFNSRAEAEFVSLVSGLIADGGSIRVREVLAEAAFELNISIETAKRYLLKYTARRAPFEVTGGVVTLREVTDGN